MSPLQWAQPGSAGLGVAEGLSTGPGRVTEVSARAQPAQQAPPVQRLRVRYAKRGRARFTSSRDFGRAFERALRRAAVPMAYSSGYSPHPRISYANASPTGAESEAEYLEIGLTRSCDPEQVRLALDSALPPGLDVVDVVEAWPGALADALTASSWHIDVVGVSAAVLESAVAAVLATESVVVERMTKSGLRVFDVRPAIMSLSVERPPDDTGTDDTGTDDTGTDDTGTDDMQGRITLITRHQEPLVRPDDVLTAMALLTPEFRPAEVPILRRLWQGTIDDGTGELRDPFRQG